MVNIKKAQNEREKQYFMQSHAPNIVTISSDMTGHMDRYEDADTSRRRILMAQRLKVKPSETLMKQLLKKKKQLRKGKKTNLKGELAQINKELKKMRLGEYRRRDEDPVRVMGVPVAGAVAPVPVAVAPVPGAPPVPPAPFIVPPVVVGGGGPAVPGAVGAAAAPAIPPALIADLGAIRGEMRQIRADLGQIPPGETEAQRQRRINRDQERYDLLMAALEVQRGHMEGIRGEARDADAAHRAEMAGLGEAHGALREAVGQDLGAFREAIEARLEPLAGGQAAIEARYGEHAGALEALQGRIVEGQAAAVTQAGLLTSAQQALEARLDPIAQAQTELGTNIAAQQEALAELRQGGLSQAEAVAELGRQIEAGETRHAEALAGLRQRGLGHQEGLGHLREAQSALREAFVEQMAAVGERIETGARHQTSATSREGRRIGNLETELATDREEARERERQRQADHSALLERGRRYDEAVEQLIRNDQQRAELHEQSLRDGSSGFTGDQISYLEQHGEVILARLNAIAEQQHQEQERRQGDNEAEFQNIRAELARIGNQPAGTTPAELASQIRQGLATGALDPSLVAAREPAAAELQGLEDVSLEDDPGPDLPSPQQAVDNRLGVSEFTPPEPAREPEEARQSIFASQGGGLDFDEGLPPANTGTSGLNVGADEGEESSAVDRRLEDGGARLEQEAKEAEEQAAEDTEEEGEDPPATKPSKVDTGLGLWDEAQPYLGEEAGLRGRRPTGHDKKHYRVRNNREVKTLGIEPGDVVDIGGVESQGQLRLNTGGGADRRGTRRTNTSVRKAIADGHLSFESGKRSDLGGHYADTEYGAEPKKGGEGFRTGDVGRGPPGSTSPGPHIEQLREEGTSLRLEPVSPPSSIEEDEPERGRILPAERSIERTLSGRRRERREAKEKEQEKEAGQRAPTPWEDF